MGTEGVMILRIGDAEEELLLKIIWKWPEDRTTV